MTVFRPRAKVNRVVYILQADRPQKYEGGRSRIIYIGESGKKGLGRPATSAYRKADQAFGAKKAADKLRGVRQIDVHLLTFKGKPRVKIWEVLEHDLLAVFKGVYKETPRFNHKGKGGSYSVDNIKEFRESRLKAIIRSLS